MKHLVLALLLLTGRFGALDPKQKISFPRDHGSHDDARVEWWYVTGQIETASGRRLGYQLTFFRTGIADERKGARASAFAARDLFLAHFALTDPAAGTFRFAERMHRTGAGAATAREDRLDVVNEDWRLEEVGGRLVLFAGDGGNEVSLLLTPEKPPVLHGENGLSRKGSERDAVSRYVSFTRLHSEGWWTSGGKSEAVTGLSWFDHEWGSGAIGKETQGWDWFALHLLDGRDLMIYRMRGAGGNPTGFTSGTLVETDGRSTPLAARDVTIEETSRWTSARSGGTYPARWLLRVPRAGIEVEIVPLVKDQELVTEKSTRVTYWEGACDVTAPGGGAPLGRAYVEMTGYAGAGSLGAFP
ncbi:MAG: lipocalin-like domain-containing protein [Acidobacteriota bacterium]|nr:lipocalin-like domain-containing protein [Acidobacteriota bacterium]